MHSHLSHEKLAQFSILQEARIDQENEAIANSTSYVRIPFRGDWTTVYEYANQSQQLVRGNVDPCQNFRQPRRACNS